METERPYVLGRQLGEGVDGIVRLCTSKLTGQQYACKSVSKSGSADALRHVRTEIATLEKLKGHPNVVRLEESFEDKECVHVVMEMCEGGDMFEHLSNNTSNGRLPEAQAAKAFAAIVRGVSFCHDRGVMHRDLKLENVLFADRGRSYTHLKLADFGASADFSRRRVFNDVEGTPCYLAPEILLTGTHDEKVDVWSLGVLLHILLCGYPPFDGETTAEIFGAVKRGRLDLKRDPWPSMSGPVKELMKGMLQRNPYRRMRLKDLLAHAWLRDQAQQHNSQSSRRRPEVGIQPATGMLGSKRLINEGAGH